MATNKASVKGGIGGLFDAKGAGRKFAPWPKGQYAFQCTDADDSKPTKNGDYMLKLVLSCIDTTATKEGLNGRDPIGKTFFKYQCVIPGDNFDRNVDELKMVCNAFGVKIDKTTNYYTKGPKAFIGQKAACDLTVYKKKDTGEDEQGWNNWYTIADSAFEA